MTEGSILVLEDDQNLQQLLVETLEDNDLSAQGVSSAFEALEAAERFLFDLVISDVRMAGSMDGLGALEVLKLKRPELLCIVMTGYADTDAPVRALRIHVEDYLYKPFAVEELMRCVRRVRRSRQTRSQLDGLISAFWKAPPAEETLSRVRALTLQSFWVGVRSKHLSPESALVIWDEIEELEQGYFAVISGKVKLTPAVLASGTSRYETVQRRMEQTIFRDAGTRGGERVDRKTFRAFYERLQGSAVEAEELLLAAFVRRLPEGERTRNPDFERVYTRMWAA